MTFDKWTSIDKFSDTIHVVRKMGINKMVFNRKVKLHGSNAAIRVNKNGDIAYQKRTSDVTPEEDNYGFAAWASSIDWWATDHQMDYIIYGEWAGCGINNKDAVTKLSDKYFFVFAVKYKQDEAWIMLTEPEHIARFIDPVVNKSNIKILPIIDSIEINFNDQANLNNFVDFINDEVTKIGELDTYIRDEFGIEGVGEGFVLSPKAEPNVDSVWSYNTFTFKVKTEAHSVNKSSKVKSHVVILPSQYSFVDEFVTPNRCEQMYKEHCGDYYTMKNTPIFMKALIADIEKESVNERAANNIEMKDVSKLIGARGVAWLKRKTEGLDIQ